MVVLFMVVDFILLIMAGMLTGVFLSFLTEVIEMAYVRIREFFKDESE